MDGLSSAASGIAVVSLAFQLAESIIKLYDFWDTVQEAPDEVRAIVKDRKLLRAVLNDIESNTQQYDSDPSLSDVLESAIDKVKSLDAIVTEFETGFNRRVDEFENGLVSR